jgi:hypothetical protein
MEFNDPLQTVFDKVAANIVTFRTFEIERLAPRGAVKIGEIRTKIRKAVSLWTQMVVNDVEDDGHSLLMACVYESLQGNRASVGILHRVRINAVVAPVAGSGKLRYRHEFDCGDPESE